MKGSRYNVFVALDGGDALLCNTLYGSQTRCAAGELPHVHAALREPGTAAPDLLQMLVQQHHVVTDDVDELALVRGRKRAGMGDRNRLDVIIMPTLWCNLACTYCYEEHMPSLMSESTAAAVERWIASEMASAKIVLLSWFGGEPLLATDRIIELTGRVNARGRELSVDVVSHITTNGYLLDDARINRLTAAGLHNWQITVDGPADVHDVLRRTKANQPTFDRITRNVIALARADRRVRVSLRVNFNHTNLSRIPELLHFFPADIRAQLRVVFEPIFGEAAVSAATNLDAESVAAALAQYYAAARALGYDVVLGESVLAPGKLVYCYAERERQYIINYNGDVHKCSVGRFGTSERVGYISERAEFVRESPLSAWTSMPEFEGECLDCSFLPLCMGGCRRERVRKRGVGSACALIPTNASYALKQKFYGSFDDTVRSEQLMRSACAADRSDT